MNRQLKTVFIGAAIQIMLAAAVQAAPTISVVPNGGNSYSIQGTEMDGVAGIQLDILYDSSTFKTPTATKGALAGNAMFAANTNVPGAIKIAIISTQPFSGSGVIVNITNSGAITSMIPNLINSQGKTVVSSNSTNPDNGLIGSAGIPFSETTTNSTTSTINSINSGSSNTSTQQSVNNTTTVSSSGTSVGLGTITMTTDSMNKIEHKTNEVKQPEPSPTYETAAPFVAQEERHYVEPTVQKEEPIKEAEMKQTVYSGILERFKQYKGDMTPAILISLFNKEISSTIKQEPAIAISNGTDSVHITFTLPVSEKGAPNFALTGAKMINLAKDATGDSWILEARPEKGVLKASVTILTNSSVVEYPLTLVPSTNEITSKESDFALFLKDTGVKPPKRDLNGDGLHDYQDNYIYTAYYLMLQQGEKQSKPVKTKPVKP